MMSIDAARQFWGCAADYPPDKEDPAVYGAAHTQAHGFDEHPGADVLEYGCGGGADTMSWLRRGCRVAYADIVAGNVVATTQRIGDTFGPETLARATPLFLPASAPLQINGEPLPDGLFDVVNCHGVLHHIEDPAPVLAEFFRVLRSGGSVYVMLYTEHLFTRCRPVVEGLVATGLSYAVAFGTVTDGSGCPYARCYSPGEAYALLTAAGFVVDVDEAVVYNDGDFCTYRGRKP